MTRTIGWPVPLSESWNPRPRNVAEKWQVKRTWTEYGAFEIPRHIDWVRGKIWERLWDISDSNTTEK